MRCKSLSLASSLLTCRFSGLILVVEESGLLVLSKPGGLCANTSGRRKRPGAKSGRFRAEHGPSLFDATHRFVLSGTYVIPPAESLPRAVKAVVNGWQLNTIVTVSSGTPFTVYDSHNASLQGQAPEITGFYSSRPNVLSDPNSGPHRPDQWVSAGGFKL